MKNTMSKHHDAVLAYVKANPNSTFDSIKEGNGKISDIMLRKAVKDLQEDGVITANDEDGGYTFTGSTKKTEKKADKKEQVKVEAGKIAEKKQEENDLGPKTTSSRDNSKYSFNGVNGLPKGKLALAICKQYVKDNPKTTLAKMQEVFKSKDIQPRYGIIEEIGKAKKHTVNNRERFFFKDSDAIKVGTQKAVVTNQWALFTLTPMLKIAKELGYKVTISK
jgi:hypothetical protein